MSTPESPIQDTPSTRLNPNLEDQEQVIMPTVMGPPAYGSPDPQTAAGALLPVVDHPLRATFSDDYGADVMEESNQISTVTGTEEGPETDVEAKEETDALEGMTVAELRSEARDKEIEGASSMNKAELVAAIQEYDEAQAVLDEG